jgi:hypothetical protein
VLACDVGCRRHPPPNERKLKELAAAGEKLGLNINISSAGALEASLQEIRSTCKDQNVVEVCGAWEVGTELKRNRALFASGKPGLLKGHGSGKVWEARMLLLASPRLVLKVEPLTIKWFMMGV